MALTRREFLAGANAAGMVLLLEGCNLGPIGRASASPSGAAGGRAFEQALSLLRTSLPSSPDPLAARAADAVATRDASKIVEFVRSSIAVLPPLFPSDDATTA